MKINLMPLTFMVFLCFFHLLRKLQTKNVSNMNELEKIYFQKYVIFKIWIKISNTYILYPVSYILYKTAKTVKIYNYEIVNAVNLSV